MSVYGFKYWPATLTSFKMNLDFRYDTYKYRYPYDFMYRRITNLFDTRYVNSPVAIRKAASGLFYDLLSWDLIWAHPIHGIEIFREGRRLDKIEDSGISDTAEFAGSSISIDWNKYLQPHFVNNDSTKRSIFRYDNEMFSRPDHRVNPIPVFFVEPFNHGNMNIIENVFIHYFPRIGFSKDTKGLLWKDSWHTNYIENLWASRPVIITNPADNTIQGIFRHDPIVNIIENVYAERPGLIANAIYQINMGYHNRTTNVIDQIHMNYDNRIANIIYQINMQRPDDKWHVDTLDQIPMQYRDVFRGYYMYHLLFDKIINVESPNYIIGLKKRVAQIINIENINVYREIAHVYMNEQLYIYKVFGEANTIENVNVYVKNRTGNHYENVYVSIPQRGSNSYENVYVSVPNKYAYYYENVYTSVPSRFTNHYENVYASVPDKNANYYENPFASVPHKEIIFDGAENTNLWRRIHEIMAIENIMSSRTIFEAGYNGFDYVYRQNGTANSIEQVYAGTHGKDAGYYQNLHGIKTRPTVDYITKKYDTALPPQKRIEYYDAVYAYKEKPKLFIDSDTVHYASKTNTRTIFYDNVYVHRTNNPVNFLENVWTFRELRDKVFMFRDDFINKVNTRTNHYENVHTSVKKRVLNDLEDTTCFGSISSKNVWMDPNIFFQKMLITANIYEQIMFQKEYYRTNFRDDFFVYPMPRIINILGQNIDVYRVVGNESLGNLNYFTQDAIAWREKYRMKFYANLESIYRDKPSIVLWKDDWTTRDKYSMVILPKLDRFDKTIRKLQSIDDNIEPGYKIVPEYSPWYQPDWIFKTVPEHEIWYQPEFTYRVIPEVEFWYQAESAYKDKHNTYVDDSNEFLFKNAWNILTEDYYIFGYKSFRDTMESQGDFVLVRARNIYAQREQDLLFSYKEVYDVYSQVEPNIFGYKRYQDILVQEEQNLFGYKRQQDILVQEEQNIFGYKKPHNILDTDEVWGDNGSKTDIIRKVWMDDELLLKAIGKDIHAFDNTHYILFGKKIEKNASWYRTEAWLFNELTDIWEKSGEFLYKKYHDILVDDKLDAAISRILTTDVQDEFVFGYKKPHNLYTFIDEWDMWVWTSEGTNHAHAWSDIWAWKIRKGMVLKTEELLGYKDERDINSTFSGWLTFKEKRNLMLDDEQVLGFKDKFRIDLYTIDLHAYKDVFSVNGTNKGLLGYKDKHSVDGRNKGLLGDKVKYGVDGRNKGLMGPKVKHGVDGRNKGLLGHRVSYGVDGANKGVLGHKVRLGVYLDHFQRLALKDKMPISLHPGQYLAHQTSEILNLWEGYSIPGGSGEKDRHNLYIFDQMWLDQKPEHGLVHNQFHLAQVPKYAMTDYEVKNLVKAVMNASTWQLIQGHDVLAATKDPKWTQVQYFVDFAKKNLKYIHIHQDDFSSVVPIHGKMFNGYELFCDKREHNAFIEFEEELVIKDKIRGMLSYNDDWGIKDRKRAEVDYEHEWFNIKKYGALWYNIPTWFDMYVGTGRIDSGDFFNKGFHNTMIDYEDEWYIKFKEGFLTREDFSAKLPHHTKMYYTEWADRDNVRDISIFNIDTYSVPPTDVTTVEKDYVPFGRLAVDATYREIDTAYRKYYDLGIHPDDFGNWAWVYETPDPFEKDRYGIDELLLPENDTRYEDFEELIFNRKTRRPRNPVKKIDDNTWIAKLPPKHPFKNFYETDGNVYVGVKYEQYFGVRISIMHQIFLKYYQIWQSHLFEFATMSMLQSTKLMLEYLYSWIHIWFPPDELEEAIRIFRQVRWYSERAVLNNSQYIITGEWTDLPFLEIENNLDGNDTMYYDEHNGVIRNNPAYIGATNAYVEFYIDTFKNTTIKFSLINNIGSVNIYIDGVLVDTLSKNTLNTIYPLNYTGDIITVRIEKTKESNLNDQFMIGAMSVAGIKFDKLEVDFDPTLKAGNKPMAEIVQKMLQYANLHDDATVAYEHIRKANLGISVTMDKLLEYWKYHHEGKIKGKRLTIKEV